MEAEHIEEGRTNHGPIAPTAEERCERRFLISVKKHAAISRTMRREAKEAVRDICTQLATGAQRDREHQESLDRLNVLLTKLIDVLGRLEEARLSARTKVLLAIIGILGTVAGALATYLAPHLLAE